MTQPTIPRWRARIVAVMALVCALMAVIWISQTPREYVPLAPGSEPASGAFLAGDHADDRSSPARSDTIVQPVHTVRQIRGRVLDRLFDLPISARVTPNRGAGVFSDRSTGRFEFDAAETGIESLRTTAPGFEPLEIHVSVSGPVEEVTIRLRSTRFASIIVQDRTGLPVARAPVAWHAADRKYQGEDVKSWIYADPEPLGHKLEAKTDELGVSRVELTLPAVVTVTDPRYGTRVSVRVAPGQEQRVTLPEQPLALQFIAGLTASPSEGLDIEAWYPREIGSTVTSLRTGSDGIVQIAPTSFPILVRLAGFAVWQCQLVPSSQEITLVGFGGKSTPILRIDRPATSPEPLRIEVLACGGKLRLIDDVSGTPITALVRLKRREAARCEGKEFTQPSACTIASPRDEHDDVGGTFRVRQGILDLPCIPSGLGSAQSLVVLAVKGYLPLRLPGPVLPGRPTDPELELRLRPAVSRTLHVVQSDSRPFRQPVAVYSPMGDIIVWMDRGSDDGVHGPFDWGGGDLMVRAGEGDEWSHRILAQDLVASEIVTLTLPTSTGTLVVEGVPPEADASQLVAKLGVGRSGTVNLPTVIESGRCRFDALPVGHYCVGPAQWIQGAESQSVEQEQETFRMTPRPSRTLVKAGEVTVVRWLDVWEAGQVFEGQVASRSPVTVELFVVPLYGAMRPAADERPDEMPRMVFGRRSAKIPLDREGRYRIGEHDPLPRLLVICAADDGLWGTVQGMRVLETILPGESIELWTGALELVDKGGARNADLDVNYCVEPESLRYPLGTFHKWSRNDWAPGTVLRLEGIPLQVRQILIRGTVVPIELSRDRVITIDVDTRTL